MRRLETLDILAVYIDGIVIAGRSVVVADLLGELVKRGLAPEAKRLFIIDGSKALRAAIERTFGERGLVQGCRVHDYLPRYDEGAGVGPVIDALRLQEEEHHLT